MGHWYQQDGTPCYEVAKAKGAGMRPTTLADARKLGLVPSVTTILSLVAKPALEKWKTDQLLEAVIQNPLKWQEDWEEWKKRVYAISEKVGRDAAERGTEIHDKLEHYFVRGTRIQEFDDYINPVIDLLHSQFPNVEWRSEEYFAHPDGFGGKCDLHALPCYAWPNGIILDFKTKSAEDFNKVKPYEEQCMQLVAYREGFNLPQAECYNLFISTKQPGAMLLHKWPEETCKRACKMFYSLLSYWKDSNNIKGTL